MSSKGPGRRGNSRTVIGNRVAGSVPCLGSVADQWLLRRREFKTPLSTILKSGGTELDVSLARVGSDSCAVGFYQLRDRAVSVPVSVGADKGRHRG